MCGIKPKFNKKIPEKAIAFFLPSSDDTFRAKHPKAYNALVVLGIVALGLPLFAYVIGISFLTQGRESGWLIVGFIGAFLIGIGLFNIVAAWIGQYLGHFVTAACFILGALMIGFTVLMLGNDTLYYGIDQKVVNYYFLTHLFLAFIFIFYVQFRSLMRLCFHGLMRKKNWKQAGFLKKMFYEPLRSAGLQEWVYWGNKIYLILYPALCICHLLAGWIKPLAVPFSILFAVLGLLSGVLCFMGSVLENRRMHGRSFVLYARKKDGHGVSSLMWLIWACFPIAAAYAQLDMAFGLNGIKVW